MVLSDTTLLPLGQWGLKEGFLEWGIQGGLGLVGESRRAKRKSWATNKPSLGGASPFTGTFSSGGAWWEVPQSQSWPWCSAPQAEYDAMLLEYAGEAIPALAAAAGGDTFAPFFAGFLPLLLCKTVSALPSGFKPHSAQRPHSVSVPG